MANYITVCTEKSQSITIVDVTNPNSISIEAEEYPLGYSPDRVVMNEKFAYAVAGDRIFVIDVLSSPSNPVELGSNIINVSEEYPGIMQAYDPSALACISYDSDTVIFVGQIYNNDPDNYPFIGSGIWKINVVDPSNPYEYSFGELLPFFIHSFSSSAIYVHNGILFIASEFLYTDIFHEPPHNWVGNNIVAWDFSQWRYTSGRTLCSRQTTYSNYTGIVGSGDYVYVSTRDKIFSLNVSNPPSMALMDTFALTSVKGIETDGNYLYVACSATNSVCVIDISDPTNLSIHSYLTDSTNLEGAQAIKLDPHRDVAYIACPSSNRITTVDISNPASLSVMDSLQDNTYLDSAEDIGISNTLVKGATIDSYVKAVETATCTIDAVMKQWYSTCTIDTYIETTIQEEVTIGTNGALRDYTSFSTWEATEQKNLVDQHTVHTALFYNDGLMSDSFVLSGWTTDENYNITIRTPSSERHNGTPDTGAILSHGVNIGMEMRVPNVTVEGISFLGTNYSIMSNFISGSGFLKFSHNFFRGRGIRIYRTSVPVYAWNNFIVMPGTSTADRGLYTQNTTQDHYFYSNSIYGGGFGIYVTNAGNVRASNNVVGNTNDDDFFQTGWFHADSNYNASEDVGATSKAPGANSVTGIVPADNFKDLTVGSEDIHIKDTSADIYHTGTDLSEDSDLAVVDDIDGQTRLTFDIGGDFYPFSTLTSDATVDTHLVALLEGTVDAKVYVEDFPMTWPLECTVDAYILGTIMELLSEGIHRSVTLVR